MSVYAEYRAAKEYADGLRLRLDAGGLSTVERTRLLAELTNATEEAASLWGLARYEETEETEEEAV